LLPIMVHSYLPIVVHIYLPVTEDHSDLYQMNWGWRNLNENNGWFAYGNITGGGTLYNSSNMKAYIIRP
jgi:hypothetical protein